jgi:hypothetical protein
MDLSVEKRHADLPYITFNSHHFNIYVKFRTIRYRTIELPVTNRQVQTVLRTIIFIYHSVADPDPHYLGKPDPEPHLNEKKDPVPLLSLHLGEVEAQNQCSGSGGFVASRIR